MQEKAIKESLKQQKKDLQKAKKQSLGVQEKDIDEVIVLIKSKEAFTRD